MAYSQADKLKEALGGDDDDKSDTVSSIGEINVPQLSFDCGSFVTKDDTNLSLKGKFPIAFPFNAEATTIMNEHKELARELNKELNCWLEDSFLVQYPSFSPLSDYSICDADEPSTVQEVDDNEEAGRARLALAKKYAEIATTMTILLAPRSYRETCVVKDAKETNGGRIVTDDVTWKKLCTILKYSIIYCILHNTIKDDSKRATISNIQRDERELKNGVQRFRQPYKRRTRFGLFGISRVSFCDPLEDTKLTVLIKNIYDKILKMQYKSMKDLTSDLKGRIGTNKKEAYELPLITALQLAGRFSYETLHGKQLLESTVTNQEVKGSWNFAPRLLTELIASIRYYYDTESWGDNPGNFNFIQSYDDEGPEDKQFMTPDGYDGVNDVIGAVRHLEHSKLNRYYKIGGEPFLELCALMDNIILNKKERYQDNYYQLFKYQLAMLIVSVNDMFSMKHDIILMSKDDRKRYLKKGNYSLEKALKCNVKDILEISKEAQETYNTLLTSYDETSSMLRYTKYMLEMSENIIALHLEWSQRYGPIKYDIEYSDEDNYQNI